MIVLLLLSICSCQPKTITIDFKNVPKGYVVVEETDAYAPPGYTVIKIEDKQRMLMDVIEFKALLGECLEREKLLKQ